MPCGLTGVTAIAGCSHANHAHSEGKAQTKIPCPFHSLRIRERADLLARRKVAISRLVHAEKGTKVGLREADGVGVIAVRSGALKLTKSLPDGRTQIVGLRYPGDLVTLTAFDDDSPIRVGVVMPSVLCVLDRGIVQHASKSDNDLYFRLVAQARKEIAQAYEHIMTLGRKAPIERLASFLLELDDRLGRQAEPGGEIRIPLTRLEIGDYLGMESETVSRLFTRLKTSGAVAMSSPSRITILDRDELAFLANGFIPSSTRAVPEFFPGDAIDLPGPGAS